MGTEQIDLESYFSALAREVAERVFEEKRGGAPPSGGALADDHRCRLERIMAKLYVSVGEAALLLNCSDSYLRKLVKRAQKKETRHPIPFTDLDCHVVFELSKLLAWAEQPKPGRRASG